VIYNNLGYSKIDKNKISKIFGLSEQDIVSEDYLHIITSKAEQVYDKNIIEINDKCKQLQQKWEDYQDKYFKVLKDIFDIDINYNIKTYTYCYLQMLPINEIDLKDNIIYLDCNKDVDELFNNFIIMLTKAILIDRWNDVNHWDFNTDFDVKNKIWMFAEISIDAIFAHSELALLTNTPSYKYLYSLKVKGNNVMDGFRALYEQITLDEFFTEVYMFVHDNYQTISQFQHYLY
jgi:hypothetical protein